MCVVPMFFAAAIKLRNANRDQRAERNLERARAAADADILRAGAMNVDGIPAHANRIS